MPHTTIKIKEIAAVLSGQYLQVVPNGEVAYLQVKDFTNPEPAKTAFRVAATSRTDASLLKKGDVLFAGKGATYLATVFNDDIPAVASTAFFVIRITSDAILPEFLCWFLKQQQTQSYFKSLQTCTVTPMIRKPNVEELNIIFPDITTQKKIVETSLLIEREYQLRNEIAQKTKFHSEQLLMQIVKK